MSAKLSILSLGAALAALTLIPSSYASITLTCNASVSATGGSSSSDPTSVGGVCNTTSFDVTGATIPSYWEFTWVGLTQPDTIIADVSGDHSGATLVLDNSSGVTIASDGFAYISGLGYSVADVSPVTLTFGTQYIVGIASPTADPTIVINFNSAVSPTPEPESIALLGTGLALIPVVRRKLVRA